MDSELKKRVSKCIMLMKKTNLFWLKAQVPTKLKLRVMNAVIRAALLYGTETARIKPDGWDPKSEHMGPEATVRPASGSLGYSWT